jgi:hypothetical protein
MIFSSCSSTSTDKNHCSLQLKVKDENIILTKEQNHRLQKLSLDYLKSSNFNTSGTGPQVNLNLETINSGYKKALVGNHIKIVFTDAVTANCHGGEITFTELVIGPFQNRTIGAPYVISDKGHLIGFGKYSGALAVQLKQYVSTITTH